MPKQSKSFSLINMQKLKAFLFQNTSTKQTLAKNTFWLLTSEVFGRLLRMALIVYAARTLGASGWGIFSYATSIGIILMTFSDIGISSVVTRELSQRKEGFKDFVTTALVIKAGLILLSIVLVLTISPLLSNVPETVGIFPIIAAISLFDSLREICFSINVSFEKMERETLVKTLMNIIILVMGIILIKMNATPKSMAWAYAIGSFVGFVLIAIIMRKNIRNILGKFNSNIIKSILSTTWPLTIISLIMILLANIDTFMLGIWKNAEDIGLYASVQRVFAFTAIIPSAISVATLPVMSKLAKDSHEKFRIVVEKTLAILLIFGAPVALGGMLLSKEIVVLLFGEGYLAAAPIMVVMMALVVFSFPLATFSNAVFAHNKQKSVTAVYLLGIILNVILNAILIPRLGALGAAYATLVSTFVISTSIIIKLKKINYFRIRPAIKSVFIPMIFISIVIISLKHLGVSIVPLISISVVIYFGSLLYLKRNLIKEFRKIVSI